MISDKVNRLFPQSSKMGVEINQKSINNGSSPKSCVVHPHHPKIWPTPGISLTQRIWYESEEKNMKYVYTMKNHWAKYLTSSSSLEIKPKICANEFGMIPLNSGTVLTPSIVKVFPVPVWPYAKIVPIKMKALLWPCYCWPSYIWTVYWLMSIFDANYIKNPR